MLVTCLSITQYKKSVNLIQLKCGKFPVTFCIGSSFVIACNASCSVSCHFMIALL